ncbi:type II toxin-antitoxin system HicA family toxin [Fibrisoma montanum]|uniref:Type II toxin-antitoxin system HicA family toxin n=1 Tax=Fibrisoma montanum TaxID=2305895 RepID=A0A418M4B8_9BACT|nr:type II toxin-antitoxin system HicA family toxin [Fibrisoma montanum]RIV20504.1 type II toxin-antitoxin system HicA family toxin [Fibrisoma montanum]
MTARELIKRLEAAGWVEVRQAGSHRIFKNPNFQHNLSVPDHGKQDLKPGLVNKLLKQAGLK